MYKNLVGVLCACVLLKSSLVMNKFSHILSTNYGASVTDQPSWNLCAAQICCLVMIMMTMAQMMMKALMENEPSWKLYAVTAVYLVDDCSSGATVESDSAWSTS